MEHNKCHILRRIIETIVIELFSSVFIFMLTLAEIIPTSNMGYIIGFGASALIFLLLSFRVLYAHFWALDFSITKYLSINISIWVLCLCIGFVGLKYFPNNVYTAFFGYTKPFRRLLYVSDISSAVIFWILYLLTIIAVIIKVLYFDYDYAQLIWEEQEFSDDD